MKKAHIRWRSQCHCPRRVSHVFCGPNARGVYFNPTRFTDVFIAWFSWHI